MANIPVCKEEYESNMAELQESRVARKNWKEKEKKKEKKAPSKHFISPRIYSSRRYTNLYRSTEALKEIA